MLSFYHNIWHIVDTEYTLVFTPLPLTTIDLFSVCMVFCFVLFCFVSGRFFSLVSCILDFTYKKKKLLK